MSHANFVSHSARARAGSASSSAPAEPIDGASDRSSRPLSSPDNPAFLDDRPSHVPGPSSPALTDPADPFDSAPQPYASFLLRCAAFGTLDSCHAYSTYAAHCTSCSQLTPLSSIPSAVFAHNGRDLSDVFRAPLGGFLGHSSGVNSCNRCCLKLGLLTHEGFYDYLRLRNNPEHRSVVLNSPYPSVDRPISRFDDLLSPHTTSVRDLFLVFQIIAKASVRLAQVCVFAAAEALFASHYSIFHVDGAFRTSISFPTARTLQLVQANPESTIHNSCSPIQIVDGEPGHVYGTFDNGFFHSASPPLLLASCANSQYTLRHPAFSVDLSGCDAVFASSQTSPAASKPATERVGPINSDRVSRRSRQPRAEPSVTPQPRAPRAPRVPRTIPTVSSALQSVHGIQEANPEVSAANNRRLTEIMNRLHALERTPAKGGFVAANFGASSMQQLLSPYSELGQMLGIRIPCSTYKEAADRIMAFIMGTELLPKRSGQRGRSLVISSSISAVVPIPTSGTGGFTTGNTVTVVSVSNASYKGVVVAAVNEAAGTFSVLAYITPDRDPEQIGTDLITLGTKLDVCVPAAITGTNVAVTAQVISETTVVKTGPLSLKAGKVAPLAIDRICPLETIGPETHSVVSFTYTDDDVVVHRRSPNDVQNTNIVSVPNSGNLTSVTTQNCPTYPEPTVCHTFNCTGFDAGSANGAGYDPAYASLFVPGGTAAITAGSTNLWQLKNNTDYLRHLLFMDFEFRSAMSFDFRSSGINVGTLTLYVDLDLGGGITATISWAVPIPAASYSTVPMFFNTRGASIPAQYRGALISNMRLVITAPVAGCFLITNTSASVPLVHIRFLDVSADSSYLVNVLSGVISGFRLGVTCRTNTEVIVDPAAQTSSMLTPTPDLPCDLSVMSTVLRLHTLSFNGQAGAFAASSFMDTLKRIGRTASAVLAKGGQIGTAIAPYLGAYSAPVAAAAGLATKASQIRGSSYSSANFVLRQPCAVEVVPLSSDAPLTTADSGGELTAEIPLSRFLSVETPARSVSHFTSILNNYCQSRGFTPDYVCVRTGGSDNSPVWVATVRLCSTQFTTPPLSGRTAPSAYLARHLASEAMVLSLQQLSDDLTLRAATFGGFARGNTHRPQFFYPAVTGHDDQTHLWAIVPVTQSGIVDSEIASAFPHTRLGSPSADIQGRSGTLAQCLAACDESGFPVRRGTFSGEVFDVQAFFAPSGNSSVDQLTEVCFTLCPVADQQAKVHDMRAASRVLYGLFPDGWYNGHSFGDFRPLDLFTPSVHVTCSEVPPPEGYTGKCYNIRAWI